MELHHEPVPTQAPAGMAHDSAEYEYAFTPPDAGHEHTDANVWILAKFALWLVISALVIHVGLLLTFRLFVEQRAANDVAEFPLAAGSAQPRLPAEPRLQRSPANDIYEFRLQEEALLHRYGWVDKNAGTVRMPIEDAMRFTVERGLPSRAADPTVDPSLMPQDSSAGRTTERRRQ